MQLPQWVPLSIMKGGTPANMLVKAVENDLGKKMYGKQLIKNIAQSVYRDRVQVGACPSRHVFIVKQSADQEHRAERGAERVQGPRVGGHS